MTLDIAKRALRATWAKTTSAACPCCTRLVVCRNKPLTTFHVWLVGQVFQALETRPRHTDMTEAFLTKRLDHPGVVRLMSANLLARIGIFEAVPMSHRRARDPFTLMPDCKCAECAVVVDPVFYEDTFKITDGLWFVDDDDEALRPITGSQEGWYRLTPAGLAWLEGTHELPLGALAYDGTYVRAMPELGTAADAIANVEWRDLMAMSAEEAEDHVRDRKRKRKAAGL